MTTRESNRVPFFAGACLLAFFAVLLESSSFANASCPDEHIACLPQSRRATPIPADDVYLRLAVLQRHVDEAARQRRTRAAAEVEYRKIVPLDPRPLGDLRP